MSRKPKGSGAKSPKKPASRPLPKSAKKPLPADRYLRSRCRKDYTDEFKVTALYALHLSGGNVNGTARRLGIPTPTLDSWAKGSRVPYLLKLQDEKRGDVARSIADNLWLLLAGIGDPSAVFKAPISQRATAFGILFDKLAMLVQDPRKVDTARVVESAPAAAAETKPDLSKLSFDEQYQLFRLLEKAGSHDGAAERTGPGELPGVPLSGVRGDGAEPGEPVSG